MKFNFSDADATVAIGGDLTFTDHIAFLDVMTRLLGTATTPIVIDVSQLGFIDSAGLGMLLIIRDEAGKANRRVILRHPRGQVKRMFDVTKFDVLFMVET
jgi:anti-anti-sigma factor